MSRKTPCYNCPRRYQGCHDPETCLDWADHIADEAQRQAAIRQARRVQQIGLDYTQESILRRMER